MKQKMNLKSGMFNGLPAYACALLLLAAGLVLSVLYAVTVGSAELSVGEVYRVILYELFRWGDPEQLGSGAVHEDRKSTRLNSSHPSSSRMPSSA